MSAVRLLARDEWAVRLEKLHCSPLQGKTKLNTAEWWRARWGFLFTLPADANGFISENDLQSVIADVLASAPQGYRFEDN